MPGRGGATSRGTTVPIPVGVWGDEPIPRRELMLRPVDSVDEVFLLDTAEELGPAERASALLARCLVSNGAADDGMELLGRLTAGDREAALLHLRRLTLGERLEAVIACPVADCGELMELELVVNDLLVPPVRRPSRAYRITLDRGAGPLVVRFRLPTGSDLHAVASASRADPAAGVVELLRRCVLGATEDGHEVALDQIDAAAVAAISTAMADRDPQAVVELDLVCSGCGAALTVPFDAGGYLLQELDVRATRLLADVHALALHYHWSERDILSLPPDRRARYLDFLAESLGAGSITARLVAP